MCFSQNLIFLCFISLFFRYFGDEEHSNYVDFLDRNALSLLIASLREGRQGYEDFIASDREAILLLN